MPAPRIASELPPDVLEALNQKLRNRAITYASISKWLRERGWNMSPMVVRTYAHSAELRRSKRHADLKIELTLTPEHLKEYETLLSDVRTTQRIAEAWLAARGYRIGSTAVRTHRLRHLEAFDRIRDSAKVAEALVAVASEQGPTKMAQGVAMRGEQVVFEQLMKLPEKEALDPQMLTEHLKNACVALKSRHTLEQMRSEFEKANRLAVAACQDAAKKGASGKDVVLRMKEILGV
jgi:hypothetical protein